MKAFAQLLDRLSYSPSRNAKLRLLREYFRSTSDPDRGWALAVLTDGLPFSFPLRRALLDMMARRMDPELFRLSRDYVGDTAETIALVWSAPTASHAATPAVRSAAALGETRPPSHDRDLPPRLSEIISELALIGET